MPWQWNKTAKRYQNSDTGQFLSNSRALELVEQSLASAGDKAIRLAELAANGNISPFDWRTQFGEQLKQEYIRQSMLGRGGRLQMTQSDWGAIGGRLRPQYALMDEMAAKIADGEFSEAQLKVFQQNYLSSGRQVYERSKAASQDVPPSMLPAYPGDGSTQCRSNCRCSWYFEFTETEILAYWGLERGAKHCPDCEGRSITWNPYRIVREEG